MTRLVNLGDVAVQRSLEDKRTAVVQLEGIRPVRRVTYAALAQLTGGVAAWLAEQKFARGARLVVVGDNSIDYLALFHGIMRAGLTVVPVSNKFPGEVLNHIIDDCSASLVFSDGTGSAVDAIGGRVDVVPFGGTSQQDISSLLVPQDFHTVIPVEGEPAEVLYTSGSTGMPKGVLLDHAGQLSALGLLQFESDPNPERQILAQPLFHMNGIVVQCLALIAGDTLYLQPRFRASDYVAAIDAFAITKISAVPTMWSRALKMAEEGRASLASVQMLSLGSAPLTQDLVDRTRANVKDTKIAISYGTTEAGPAVFGPHPQDQRTPDLSCGYPLPGVGVELRGAVAHPDGGETGVLWMRTTAMMVGYLNRPDQTSEVLVDGWYNTRDVMSRDPEGFYFFVGRADDMFVCGGENIYPLEVESVIERHPDVSQAAVVALEDADRGQIPVAFVVMRASAQLTVVGMQRFVLEHAAPHLQPRRIALVDQLPHAGTHKVDKAALAIEASRREQEGSWSK